MEILHCTADFNKVYYVEYKGALRQCKLICTKFDGLGGYPEYVLEVAGEGIVSIEFDRKGLKDSWYYKTTAPSILYEDVDSFLNNRPIEDEYGTTNNCRNSKFLEPLFQYHTPCNNEGSIYTWKWNGTKAELIVHNNDHEIPWSWDKDGFHCELNSHWYKDCYRSKEECERNNEIKIVTFD